MVAAGEASPADIGGTVAPGGPFQDRVGKARQRASAEWRALHSESALPSGGTIRYARPLASGVPPSPRVRSRQVVDPS